MKSRSIRPSFSGQFHWILIGLVWLYVGWIVGMPLLSLIWKTASEGAKILNTFQDIEFFRSLGLTLQISLWVLFIHSIFGTIVAWVLVRHRFWGRNFINSLIDLPFAVSPVVVGYMILLLFGRNGLLSHWLNLFEWQVVFAVPGMILATLFVSLPFLIRELMPVLSAFGEVQEKAAHTLGANGWQTFWWVTFPALRWGFLYGLSLTFARAIGEFGAVLIVGGAIKGKTESATLFIYRVLDERQYAEAYTAAILLGLFAVGLALLADNFRRAIQSQENS
jgi:sulfate transport system permease protein